MTKKKTYQDNIDRKLAKTRIVHTRRDDDKIKDLHIGLYDIDNAIRYYFEKFIKPNVTIKNKSIDVPVIYGSPEKWKAIRKDGYYRDRNRKIMVPLIMYKRDNIENRTNLSKNIDPDNPLIHQEFRTSYNKRNKYTPFSAIRGEVPEKELYNVIVPNFIKLNYSFIIWTDFVEQMNKIVEAINYSNEAYWGDKNRFKFYTKIDSFDTPVEVSQGEDRAIKTSFTAVMSGYIIPDSVQKYAAQNSMKIISLAKIVFDTKIS